jgi:hypothetical protein
LDVLKQLHEEQLRHIAVLEAESEVSQKAKGQQQQQQQQEQALGGTGQPSRALPLQCWVLDSQPGTVTAEEDGPTSVGRILSFIAQQPMPVASRQSLVSALEREGLPRSVAWWLGSGLAPASPAEPAGPLRWAFDARGAAALYHSYRMSDCWAALERPPAGVTLHLVRGERSDR